MHKPKTKYILNKIKGESFSNTRHREYIDDLIEMEKLLLVKGCPNKSYAMGLSFLKNRHPKAFIAIFKETDPKGYKKWLQQEEKEKIRCRKKMERDEKREEKEEQKEKKIWIKLGGIE